MATPTPYVHFPGTAREALTFYAGVFGGEVRLYTFAEFNRDDGPADAVAHGVLEGPVAMFAADVLGDPSFRSEGLMLSLLGTAPPATLRTWFAGLADGGRVVDDLQQRPWGATDGQVVDRFGVHWLIGFEAEELDRSTLREALQRHWDFSGKDEDVAHEIYHDDAVLEFPQSGERFEGVANFREWRRRYPTTLDFHIRSITQRDDLVVVENLISYDSAPWMFTVHLLEMCGDRVATERIYILDGWPAPDWRAPWRSSTRAEPEPPPPPRRAGEPEAEA